MRTDSCMVTTECPDHSQEVILCPYWTITIGLDQNYGRFYSAISVWNIYFSGLW